MDAEASLADRITAVLAARPEILEAYLFGSRARGAGQAHSDIATHIVASYGRDVPDYATAIDQIGRPGVIDSGFARRFRNVAGFRNVRVHGYLEVDLEILSELLSEHLGGFETFAAQVETHLESL